ncbi:hypothetical protein [Delftia tsuruhatensis]|uniref:hypothetical protein n=1 Tax=Delftia tsuruhatensis TaxID=180282 RepID=UPI0012A85C37|nr:hypothetical protein [Delftia tsuruhatensis]QFS66549.1 hypothetical protein GCS91_20640 [Delftia tsuruhatensis]
MNQPAPTPKKQSISEDTINKMLVAQAKDQELKVRELDMRQQELKAQAEFANKMLEAQVTDRSSERTHVGKIQTRRLLAGGGALVLMLLFLAYAIHEGSAKEAFELAKILGSAAIGAIGGYGYKAAKDRSRSDQDED